MAGTSANAGCRVIEYCTSTLTFFSRSQSLLAEQELLDGGMAGLSLAALHRQDRAGHAAVAPDDLELRPRQAVHQLQQ